MREFCTMARAATLSLALALAGCGTPTVDVQTVCLPMANYTPAQQSTLAKEWAALDPNSITASQFIPDAIQMRDANKAACKK